MDPAERLDPAIHPFIRTGTPKRAWPRSRTYIHPVSFDLLPLQSPNPVVQTVPGYMLPQSPLRVGIIAPRA